MAFFVTAGFAGSRAYALSSAGIAVSRLQPAPQMKQMAVRVGHDSLLDRISAGICDGATKLHRTDLERVGRRAEAECQFQETLTGLKERIAWKAAVRARSAVADRISELTYKAS